VSQVVSTDPRRKPGIANQCRDGVAEAVRRDIGHPKLVAGFAPLPGEVHRVAQRADTGQENRLLFADEPAVPALDQRCDGERGQ